MTCLPALADDAPLATPALSLLAATPLVRVLASRCAPDAGRQGARHDGLTIAVATAGAYCHHANGYARLVEPGCVVLGRPGDAYACTHELHAGDACTVFQFAPDAHEAVVSALGARGGLQAGVFLPEADVAARVVTIDHAPERLEALAVELALAVVAGALDGAHAVPAIVRAADRDRAHAACALMVARPAEAWSLAALAAAVGTSPFHFQRAFKAVLGATPHQYLLRVRLDAALRLLAETAVPVAEVAYAAGFGDLSHFMRAFKARVGASPAAWRAGLRSGSQDPPRRAGALRGTIGAPEDLKR